jgi:hypothetical protein
MQATLDAPLTLDPQQATKLVIRGANVDFDGRVVLIHFDMVAANGTILQRRSIVVDGSQVQTWITNQENAIYTRLLAKLGVTGTVA